jgi:hypothetical protein
LKLYKNNQAKKATPAIFSEFFIKSMLLNLNVVAGPLNVNRFALFFA